MADFRGSENTHWYASQQTVDMGIAEYVGQPIEKVPGAKPGTWVNPTTVHARKYGLVQGCTSVLGEWNKPFLYDWGCKMSALGAYEVIKQGVTPDSNKEEFLQLSLQARDKIGKDAAAGGTRLHKMVELGVQGEPQDAEGTAVWTAVRKGLEAHWPNREWKAELPAVHEVLRFGCRGDLMGFEGSAVSAYADLKTREFTSEDIAGAIRSMEKGFKSLGRLTPRDTEPLQVAANLKANDPDFEFYDGCGGNIYLSRSESCAIFVVTYTKQQLEDAWEIFQCLNRIYRIKRGL